MGASALFSFPWFSVESIPVFAVAYQHASASTHLVPAEPGPDVLVLAFVLLFLFVFHHINWCVRCLSYASASTYLVPRCSRSCSCSYFSPPNPLWDDDGGGWGRPQLEQVRVQERSKNEEKASILHQLHQFQADKPPAAAAADGAAATTTTTTTTTVAVAVAGEGGGIDRRSKPHIPRAYRRAQI